eukprot:scaffold7016_cov123-Isochrysis_galbana.AAC.12
MSAGQAKPMAPVPPQPGDVAVIMYTSGTTGTGTTARQGTRWWGIGGGGGMEGRGGRALWEVDERQRLWVSGGGPVARRPLMGCRLMRHGVVFICAAMRPAALPHRNLTRTCTRRI